MTSLQNNTIISLFIKNYKNFPNELFIKDDFSEYDYSQTMAEVLLLCKLLKENNVNQGDNVGILVDEQNKIVISILSVLALDAVFVPFSLSITDKQLFTLVETAKIKTIICSTKTVPAEKTKELQNVNYIYIDKIKNDGPKNSINTNKLQLDNLQNSFSDLSTACILFTSGSTGIPKGVVLSNKNLFDNAQMMSKLFCLSEQDRILNILPFNADFALTLLYCSLFSRAKLISTKRTLAVQVVSKFKSEDITVFAAVSCYFASLIQERTKFLTEDFSKLRLLISGGGQPQKTVIDLLYEKKKNSNLDIVLLYGLTETSWSSYVWIDDYIAHPKTIGKPFEKIKFYIKNNDNISCNNSHGELIQTGGIIFNKYWENVQKTDSTIYEGKRFLKEFGINERAIFTGDIVHIDKDGFYIYEKRKDDQIKVNGFQFSVNDLETTLAQISGIINIAICCEEISVNDFSYTIFVQLKEELKEQKSQFLKQIIALIPKNIFPKNILFVDEMPFSVTGKIDKQKLKELCEVKDVH